MLFSSISFLYVFLPCVIILYFLSPKVLKNYVILASSLIFYAWGEPRYVVIMLTQIVVAYIFGILVEKYRRHALGKVVLGIAMVVNLGILVYFKYANFLMESFGQITGMSVPVLKIALPIGISFYTFQIISYIVDVYRGEVPAQKNIFILATYVVMFPQLIAGPIVRYSDVENQLVSREHSFEKMALGLQRFIVGLGKKVIIANALGELCNIFRTSSDLSVGFYWLYAVAFTLHIYFDFSGYSDMAIGLGKIFGLDFMENFNYPYISKSITEFWRRWHMSLSYWFRDYVYIPLGGNRVSKIKWFFNIVIVWLLTGFWHGAAWNFIVWGLYFAFFLLVEKFFLRSRIKKCKVLSHIYVMIIVIISFVIFNATDMSQAMKDIGGMFGIGGIPFVSREFWYYLRSYGTVILLGVLGATPIPKLITKKLSDTKIYDVLQPVSLILLIITITAYLVDGSFNPFLYFRF